MDDLAVYAGLFAVAFAASTILLMQSEAALTGLLPTEPFPATMLVAGNALGSEANWLIGRSVGRFRARKWFPASPEMLDRATKWYHRHGRWSLSPSWVPVVGDLLTVVVGIPREALWRLVAIVSVAKTARYLRVAAVTSSWI